MTGPARACRTARRSSLDCAPDLGLDLIERTDPLQRLARDRRMTALGDVVEAAPEVRPAQRERHRAADTFPIGQGIVGPIAIDLQGAGEAGEVTHGVLLAAPRRVEVGDRRRITAAPRPVVARNRPQIPGLGSPTSRIEHRAACLVRKELVRGFQGRDEPLVQWRQFERREADPVGERRAVDRDPLARQHLALAVEGKMGGVFRHEHISNERFARQAAGHETRRRGPG